LRLENHSLENIISRRPRLTTSTQRRYEKADRILATNIFVIRPYSYYVSSYTDCILSDLSAKCEQYYRFNRPYDLTSPWGEVKRLANKEEKLRSEARALEAKVFRLRKQARALRKKMRELGDREDQNIFNLGKKEAFEQLLAAPQSLPELLSSVPALRVPPSPAGFSQISFDSLDRTSLVPTDSS
jgi:hypothetical protein